MSLFFDALKLCHLHVMSEAAFGRMWSVLHDSWTYVHVLHALCTEMCILLRFLEKGVCLHFLRSFCTEPTPHAMARIGHTAPRPPAAESRVRTHDHAPRSCAGPATRLRPPSSTCSSGEQLSGGFQAGHEPESACPPLYPATSPWQRR